MTPLLTAQQCKWRASWTFKSAACWDPPTSKETGYTASIINAETVQGCILPSAKHTVHFTGKGCRIKHTFCFTGKGCRIKHNWQTCTRYPPTYTKKHQIPDSVLTRTGTDCWVGIWCDDLFDVMTWWPIWCDEPFDVMTCLMWWPVWFDDPFDEMTCLMWWPVITGPVNDHAHCRLKHPFSLLCMAKLRKALHTPFHNYNNNFLPSMHARVKESIAYTVFIRIRIIIFSLSCTPKLRKALRAPFCNNNFRPSMHGKITESITYTTFSIPCTPKLRKALHAPFCV